MVIEIIMDTFNKMFRIQCALLIVTSFLNYANCRRVNDMPEIAFQEAGFRFARNVPDIGSDEPPVSSFSSPSSISYETTFQAETEREISAQTKPTTATENALAVCSSTIQTSLIDSVLKIAFEFLEKLVDISIKDADKAFRQKFDPIVPHLSENVMSFLNHLKTDVDKKADEVVNSTLATVLEKKSSALDIINDAKLEVTNNSQNLNKAISTVFESIESWVNKFNLVDTQDFTLLKEALDEISCFGNRTIDVFLQTMSEISKREFSNSQIGRNLVLDVKNLTDDFLNHHRSNFKKLTNDGQFFTEVVSDLNKITENYKNIFAGDVNSLLLDWGNRARRETEMYFKFIENTSSVLWNLQKNLLEFRINRAKNLETIQDLDQFEKFSLSEIETVMKQIFPENSQSELLSNLSHSIENQIHDSIRAANMTSNILKNLSRRSENRFVGNTCSQIVNFLSEELCSLQEEITPVFNTLLLNSFSSLNVSILSSCFERSLRNYSEQLYACENNFIKVNSQANQTNQFFESFTTVKPTVNESFVSIPSSKYNDPTYEPFTTQMPNLKIEEFTTQFSESFSTEKQDDEESSTSILSSNITPMPNLEIKEFTTQLFESFTTEKQGNEESSTLTLSSNITPMPNLKIEEFTTQLFESFTTEKQDNEESSTSTLSSNDECTEVTSNYFEPDSYETTEATTIAVNETSSVLIPNSTPFPKFEDTTSPVQVNESKIENNTSITQLNVIPVNKTSLISVSAAAIETTTTQVILETKPSHIYKIPKVKKISPPNTSSDFSAENEIVGDPNNQPNITADFNPNSPTNQTYETKKSTYFEYQEISTQTEPTTTTEKALDVCSSTIRTSLIDSVSEIVTEVLEKLVDMFIKALNETFDQVFDPMVPPLVKKIASFLIDLKMNVDKDVEIVINSTLAIVLEKESLAIGIIGANDVVSKAFKTIELWVKEFHSVDILDGALLDEALSKISDLVDRTIDEFSYGVSEVSKNEVGDSQIARNSSSDVTNLIDEFLNRRKSNFQQIANGSELFTEVVSDLTKITEKYKNIFVKDVDSLLVDSLIRVNDEKGLFDKLLTDILLELINLRKNLLEAGINRATNSKTIQDPDQFEKNFVLEIETVVGQMFPENSQSELSSNISRSIGNQMHDSIKAVKMTFDVLKNLSSSSANGSVSGTFSFIESSLYNTIFILQKEVPPVLDMRLLNSSSSLNVSILSSTFDTILRNHSEQIDVCENSHVAIDDSTNKTNFSTSRGIFMYPFEYLLLFMCLFNYLIL